MSNFEFLPVDYASAGAIGEPGKRVFMIQGKTEDELIGVLVEKQQIELLASQSIEFLDSLNLEFKEESVATPKDFEQAGVLSPIEPKFRASTMGLIFDPVTQFVTLELRERPVDDEQNSESKIDFPLENLNDRVIRFTMTRAQLRAMAVRGVESVNAGREPCPLCQGPMDLSGHICPRLN
ncbi:MAG TPA: DUF3090 family protein [Acidimicrobiia bacterium]|nr:DUF3090 family protein [Acidimicrobiia bacterium]